MSRFQTSKARKRQTVVIISIYYKDFKSIKIVRQRWKQKTNTTKSCKSNQTSKLIQLLNILKDELQHTEQQINVIKGGSKVFFS